MNGSFSKKMLFLGIIAIMFLPAILFKSPLCSAADLIVGHDWQHFTGAEVNGTSINIMPVDRAIVPKVSVPKETDDPGTADLAKEPPTSNPPINLCGPVLQIDGDFSVSAIVDVSSNKGAYLDFYGTLPIIYDEWRQEGKRLRLGLKDGVLLLAIWNGKSPDPVIEKFGSGLTGAVSVTLSRAGGNFLIHVNGKQVGQIEDTGLFSDGEIVFGADAELGGGFTIRQLTAQAANSSSKAVIADRKQLPVYSVKPDSLRSLAASYDKPIYIGAAVAAIPLVTDEKYQSLVGQQFSMITPENDMKFQFIHPQPTIYAFHEADAIVNFAKKNDIKVHGHALVWHEALPLWMTSVKRSPDEVKQILSDHIRTIVGRYKGDVSEWDVVNEPLKDMNYNTDHGIRSANPWFKAMGEGYIDFAFREAYRADPNARLYLNEYGIEEPGEKFNALYALVKNLLDRGVPIHGIGFQMHEDMESGRYVGSNPKLVAINMQKIAALGLDVRVSEMDVNMNKKSSERSLNEQARAFDEMMAMGLRQEGLKSFGQWGVTDRYSSLAPMFEYKKLGNGLLFDANYQPKPAFFRIKQTLANTIR